MYFKSLRINYSQPSVMPHVYAFGTLQTPWKYENSCLRQTPSKHRC